MSQFKRQILQKNEQSIVFLYFTFLHFLILYRKNGLTLHSPAILSVLPVTTWRTRDLPLDFPSPLLPACHNIFCVHSGPPKITVQKGTCSHHARQIPHLLPHSVHPACGLPGQAYSVKPGLTSNLRPRPPGQPQPRGAGPLLRAYPPAMTWTLPETRAVTGIEFLVTELILTYLSRFPQHPTAGRSDTHISRLVSSFDSTFTHR